ncbi:MAG: hypothetical protein AAGN64_02445 [Bacteroidota bacterium]
MASPYGPDVRAAAELMYVIERQPKSAIISSLGMHKSTLNTWIKDGKWDEKRALEILSIPYLVREMMADIKRTYELARSEDRPLTPGERDGVQKTVKSINSLDKGALFASHAIAVMGMFQEFLAGAAPELREQLVPYVVEFTQKVASQYVGGASK